MIILENLSTSTKIGICGYSELSDGSSLVLALGTFDGVHQGHRQLLRHAYALAEKHNATPSILTFDIHPMTVICPEKAPALLTTTREKAALAADCGIRQMILIPFDEEYAQMSPAQFLDKYILCGGVNAVVCGYNYRFGKNAEGDVTFLTDYLNGSGIEICVVPQFMANNITVCSTQIRTLIQQGELELANELLGGEYMVGGVVGSGFGRGHLFNCPTANITPGKQKMLPASGVYATKIYFDGESYISLTNIGNNPTFANSDISVECHILNYSGNIYGRYVQLQFYKRLRGEKRFSSAEELYSQIEIDKNSAIAYFGSIM